MVMVFYNNMVRIITGTILFAGIGKINLDCIPSIIIEGERKVAGVTVPHMDCV